MLILQNSPNASSDLTFSDFGRILKLSSFVMALPANSVDLYKEQSTLGLFASAYTWKHS